MCLSEQFVAFDELCLRGHRYFTEVKDLSEERLSGGPLDHLFFGEEEEAEGESHKEH